MALALALSLAAVREPLGGSSPPPVYTTGAVSFDGGTGLRTTSLTATDTAFLSCSIWFWLPGDVSAGWSPLFVVDPDNNYTPGVGFRDPEGNDLFADNAEYTVDISLNGGPDQYGATGSWHNWLYSSSLAGTPSATLLLDAVDVTSQNAINGADGVLSLNTLPFYFASDGSVFTTLYLADAWVSTEALDLSDPAVVAKFIVGGKPVDLGSDGSTPTGNSPPIFLHIDSGGNPMDFRTNKGTGGNFTLSGEATTTGALVSGSADVIVADTTGITAGVRVYATGVPGATTVLSVNSGLSTVTMSAQASTTNPTADMQFGGVLQLAPSSPSD